MRGLASLVPHETAAREEETFTSSGEERSTPLVEPSSHEPAPVNAFSGNYFLHPMPRVSNFTGTYKPSARSSQFSGHLRSSSSRNGHEALHCLCHGGSVHPRTRRPSQGLCTKAQGVHRCTARLDQTGSCPFRRYDRAAHCPPSAKLPAARAKSLRSQVRPCSPT